jgi:integrase
MGTVRALVTGEPKRLDEAIAAYLQTLAGREHAGTRRTFGVPLRALAAEFGPSTGVGTLDGGQLAGWFTGRWQDRAPATWNVSLQAIRLACGFWRDQGWLTRENIPIRERTLWRMLPETAARSAEVLRLDVPDLDTANRCSRVVRKGSAADVIFWQTKTAMLLPRMLDGRKDGPLFLTGRRARGAAAGG